MNTRVNLAELRRLHEAATKGNWRADDRDVYSDCSGGNIIARRPSAVNWQSSEKWTANAAYLVAVHNALPALLDELEAARAELEALKVPLAIYERYTKLIGAAEELERLASVNQHRMFDCNDLTEQAAKLRQETEE